MRNFLSGRYGPDHLNTAIIILAVLTGCLYRWFLPLLYLSYALLVLAVFRMLSRNIKKRRSENDRFLRYWWPVRTRLTRFIDRLRGRRTHRYFRCPACRNRLQVPRGKGKISVTCPKCGERFTRRT